MLSVFPVRSPDCLGSHLKSADLSGLLCHPSSGRPSHEDELPGRPKQCPRLGGLPTRLPSPLWPHLSPSVTEKFFRAEWLLKIHTDSPQMFIDKNKDKIMCRFTAAFVLLCHLARSMFHLCFISGHKCKLHCSYKETQDPLWRSLLWCFLSRNSDKQLALAAGKWVFNDEAYAAAEIHLSLRVVMWKEKKKSDHNTCGCNGIYLKSNFP